MKMLTAVLFAVTIAGAPAFAVAQPNIGLNSLAWANMLCKQQGGSQLSCMLRQHNVQAPAVLATSAATAPTATVTEECKTLLGCGRLTSLKLPDVLARAAGI